MLESLSALHDAIKKRMINFGSSLVYCLTPIPALLFMEAVHIAWALANVAGIILVIRFWLTNVEFYSDRYGRWPGYLFILVSVLLCSRPGAERRPVTSQSSKPAGLELPDTLSFPINHPRLYEAGIYQIQVFWGGDTSPGKKVIRFNTMQSGVVLGVNWQAGRELVRLTPDGHLHYSATGTMTWSLFGFPLYTDAKVFQGEEVLQPEPYRPGVDVRPLSVAE